MTNQPAPDATWGALNEMDGDARVQEMRTRSEALADLDEAARGQQAQSMILSEYQLDDSTLQDFTESRLRAWIAVAGDDLSRAQSVATAYDKAFERVSGQIAMRRSAIVQTVARNRFTPEDIDVLYELMPKQVANIPRASQEAIEHAMEAERQANAEMSAATRSASKPWWKFW